MSHLTTEEFRERALAFMLIWGCCKDSSKDRYIEAAPTWLIELGTVVLTKWNRYSRYKEIDQMYNLIIEEKRRSA